MKVDENQVRGAGSSQAGADETRLASLSLTQSCMSDRFKGHSDFKRQRWLVPETLVPPKLGQSDVTQTRRLACLSDRAHVSPSHVRSLSLSLTYAAGECDPEDVGWNSCRLMKPRLVIVDVSCCSESKRVMKRGNEATTAAVVLIEAGA